MKYTTTSPPSVPCTSQVRGTFARPPPDIPTFPKWYPKSPPLTFPANCGILCPLTSARRAPSFRRIGANQHQPAEAAAAAP